MGFKNAKSSAKKRGKPPGTLIYTGTREEAFRVFLMDYDKEKVEEKEIQQIEEILPYLSRSSVTWVNIVGLHRTDAIEKLGNLFHLHPLVLEDIVNVHQRPKVEIYEDYIFIVLQMISWDQKAQGMELEQVSLILGKNYVLTFQERPGDVFDPIRERIRMNKGMLRKNKEDYLFYALLDIIVDNYFLVLDRVGDSIEDMEEKVLTHPSPDDTQEIHRLKRDLLVLRRAIWPLREVLSSMMREDEKLLTKETKLYLRDIYDHVIQSIDILETLRELINGVLDIYLSSVSNKMNEIMKVLTIIATIFIPLTFLAGVYGMNFKYMPELEWKWGYFAVWLVMIGVALSLLVYFKRKKWL